MTLVSAIDYGRIKRANQQRTVVAAPQPQTNVSTQQAQQTQGYQQQACQQTTAYSYPNYYQQQRVAYPYPQPQVYQQAYSYPYWQQAAYYSYPQHQPMSYYEPPTPPPYPQYYQQPQPQFSTFSQPVANPAPLPKVPGLNLDGDNNEEPTRIPKYHIDRDAEDGQQIKLIPIRERIRMNLEARGMKMPTEEELEEIWEVKDIVQCDKPLKITSDGVTYDKSSNYRPWYDVQNLLIKYPKPKEDMSEYDLTEEDAKEIEECLNSDNSSQSHYDNSDAVIERDMENTRRNMEALSQQNPVPGVEVGLGYRTPDPPPPPMYNQMPSQPISYQPPQSSPFQKIGFDGKVINPYNSNAYYSRRNYIPCANEIALDPYAFDDDESYYEEFERIRKAKCTMKMNMFEYIQKLRNQTDTEEGKKQWREYNRLYGYRPLLQEAEFQKRYFMEEEARRREEAKKMDDLSTGPWLGERRLSNGDIVYCTKIQYGVREYDTETGEYSDVRILSKPNNPKTGYRIVLIDTKAQAQEKFNREHWKDVFNWIDRCNQAQAAAYAAVFGKTKYDDMSLDELLHGGLFEWEMEKYVMPNHKRNMAMLNKMARIRPKSEKESFARSGINTRFGFATSQANSFIPNTNLAREYNCMRTLDYGNGLPYDDSHLSRGMTREFDALRQRFFDASTIKPGYGVFEQRKQLPIGSFEPTTDMYNLTAQEAENYINQVNGIKQRSDDEMLQKAKMAISGALI